MDTFDLEQIISLKMAGNVFVNWQIGKLSDDQKINTVTVVSKNIFRLEILDMD